jgi:hypothetical protein
MNNPRTLGRTLLLLGVLTVGTGVYFMLVRPPLLPEDLHFIGLAADAIPPAVPPWLSIVFRTWGGFVMGFGLCLLGQAGYFLTHREGWIRCGTALGVLIAFGSFLASNIQLRSDFLWFIALLFAVALSVALLLVAPLWSRRAFETQS